jgi:hypothetical protein
MQVFVTVCMDEYCCGWFRHAGKRKGERMWQWSIRLIIFLVSPSVFSQSLATAPSEAATRSLAESLTTPPMNGGSSVERLYGSLERFAKPDRVRFYNEQPPTVRRDLWVIHLEHVLAANPQLTSEERGVILEAIGLILSGGVRFDLPLSDQAPAAIASIEELESRAKLVLPPQMLVPTFGALGGAERALPDFLGRRLGASVVDDCTCHVGSQYTCDNPTGPEPYCIYPLPPKSCAPTQGGCGFFFMESCNGICSTQPPPP